MATTFPKRSIKSDDQAFVVKLALDAVVGTGRAPEPFMVTVIVSDQGRCFVGLSGSHDALGERLEAHLSLARSVPAVSRLVDRKVGAATSLAPIVEHHKNLFDPMLHQHRLEFPGSDVATVVGAFAGTELENYFDPGLQAERLKAKTVTFGASHLARWDAHVSLVNLEFKADWLARELRQLAKSRAWQAAVQSPAAQTRTARTSQVDLQSKRDPALRDKHEKSLARHQIKPNWNCSEPKALMAAAESGEALEGMTTFWFGDAANDTYGKYKLDDGAPLRARLPQAPAGAGRRALLLCRPCETCAQNEERIMAAVEIARIGKRGGGGTKIWSESPAAIHHAARVRARD